MTLAFFFECLCALGLVVDVQAYALLAHVGEVFGVDDESGGRFVGEVVAFGFDELVDGEIPRVQTNHRLHLLVINPRMQRRNPAKRVTYNRNPLHLQLSILSPKHFATEIRPRQLRDA